MLCFAWLIDVCLFSLSSLFCFMLCHLYFYHFIIYNHLPFVTFVSRFRLLLSPLIALRMADHL